MHCWHDFNGIFRFNIKMVLRWIYVIISKQCPWRTCSTLGPCIISTWISSGLYLILLLVKQCILQKYCLFQLINIIGNSKKIQSDVIKNIELRLMNLKLIGCTLDTILQPLLIKFWACIFDLCKEQRVTTFTRMCILEWKRYILWTWQISTAGIDRILLFYVCLEINF